MSGEIRRELRRVLIVEDDERLLAAYTRAFQATPLDVVTATNAAEARGRAQETNPDMCVIDYQLPGGESGLQLISGLRHRDPLVTLVFVTGYGYMELGAEAARHGADHVLAKPVHVAEILSRVAGSLVDDSATASDARARWEHIQRVLQDSGGNRSEAARRLGLSRGTLQRWLDRPAPVR